MTTTSRSSLPMKSHFLPIEPNPFLKLKHKNHGLQNSNYTNEHGLKACFPLIPKCL